ncbi:hypothetical protein L1F30_12970 [Simiduia sp. 21SJ11W-1]|uniref:hypothetical protein n=1 Tax=Simiduia sp. 21SJ11W-1 TaxID=2909669 RepID=UPI00209F991F|nr:hypothetical protein [Simiduia sp. 21SJ11W-1]UTA47071.1 hypothetical protein L1F30_12970 [Simiduia sp. 21SJ11W-1]
MNHLAPLPLRALLLVAALLAGCATKNQYTPIAQAPAFEAGNLPPIAVFTQHPSNALRKACSEFTQQSLMHHCRLNTVSGEKIQQALYKSGQFSAQDEPQYTPDYTLQLATARYHEEKVEDLGNAVVSGLSLMLVPLLQTFEFHTEVNLRWRGQLLDTFSVTAPFTQSVNLANPQTKFFQQTAEAVAAALLAELSARNSFSPEFLAEKLQSTHYGRDLQLPQSAGNYLLDERLWLRHPLQGTVVNFIHKDFQFDQFTLSIYPLRRLDWHDTEAAIAYEANALQADIQATAAAHNTEVSFDTPAHLTWKIRNTKVPVIYLTGKHTGPEGEQLTSRIYILAQQDKALLASSTLEGENPPLAGFEQAVQALTAELQVPPESPFMAGLRTELRKQQTKAAKQN